MMLHKYLPLLEMTDLIKSVPKFSKKPLKFRRGNVKCYLVDLALRNALLKLGEKVLEEEAMLGYYAENLVFNALRGFEGVIDLSYCKEKNSEIDFIVNLGSNRYVPVEVKYREKVEDVELIKHFINKYNQNFGIVVTKDFESFNKDTKLIFIPLSLFLLFF
jgi:predicted AAA+ superfamily ATPase